MGKGSGFNAPIEAIENTGQEVKGLADKAKGIADQGSEAEVSDEAWGQVGKLVKGKYDELLKQFTEHMDQANQGFKDAADKLADTAQDYGDTDAEQLDAITKVQGQLKKGGKA